MNSLLIGNDQTIQLLGVFDVVADAYINDAVVTARVIDRLSVETEGETWPISLTYVPTSNGDYIGQVESTVELAEGRRYWVEVKATQAGEDIGLWRELMPARYRTFSE